MPTLAVVGTYKMQEPMPLLSVEDHTLCKTKVGEANQIAFGLMLAHFRIFSRFPAIDDHPNPLQLLNNVCAELNYDPDMFEFDWSSRTAKRFRREIRKHLGYREVIESDAADFIEHLIKTVLPQAPSKELLQEQITRYFQSHKIECFKHKQLTRYIASAKHQFEQLLFADLVKGLDENDKCLIDQILATPANDKQAEILGLAELKKDIPGARLKHVNHAIKKICLLQKLSLSPDIFKAIDRKLLLKYHDSVMVLSPSNLQESGDGAKYALMAIFCYVRSELFLDSMVDIFTKLIHRMRINAESFVNKNILKDVKRVDGKFDILERLARATANTPHGVIKDIVYPDVPRALLLDLIKDLNQRGKWYQSQVREKINSNYVHGNRPLLLSLLRQFDFREDHELYNPMLEAIAFINEHWDSATGEYYQETPPLDGVISEIWKPMVLTETENGVKVNKYNYEIAILEQLKVFLGYKAIWVNGAYRFRNPNEDTPQYFDQNRAYYYELLGLPLDKKVFSKNLKQLLESNLSSLNCSIPGNELVTLKFSSTGRNISITPSEPQAEPDNIERLQQEIAQRWSTINLIDILKECDLRINFTEQMETLGKSSSISAQELQRRLLLCLYGIGSNTGLKRISIANGDVSFNDLRYTKKRFINTTNVRSAIKKVVNHVLDIRDPMIWGEATTSIACDSTQVSAWDQNLLNEWHHRYKGKGVMIYWHVDKKALCIYSQLKTCSSSEVGAMIKGVVDHDTQMNMNEVFVDTHGQSVVGFAVSHMLGFDLLPRLKGINKQKLYGVSSKEKEKYTNLSLIMQGCINWKLIEDNYDAVVKYMAALKLGIVEPSVLIKRFSRDNYKHPIYKALMEIGKAQKTIFLCNYLASEALRIEINEGLNVVERLNNVMDFIFYGKLGEMKTNNTDDQELSVLCLHLLQACMVYINTLIIQQVLSEPHWANKLTPEDYRALTPLLSAHINPYGLFPIDFDQRIALIHSSYPEASNDQEQANAGARESQAVIEIA